MKSLFAVLAHRRLQRSLVLYADGELPPNELAQTRQHLDQCPECREQLADIRACRKLLKAERAVPFIPAEQLWRRIAGKTSASSPAWLRFGEILVAAPWQYWRWPVIAAGLILFTLTVWKANQADRGAAAVIDYGIFLDDVQQENSAANFHQRYAARVIEFEEAQQAVAFPLAAIAALPDSFRLDCVRVLECNGKKCIQFTCYKAGKAINIFQHALGQPWTLGQYAVARTPICNVPCLLVKSKDLAAVGWQGKHSEYFAVGELTPQELAQVVQVLQ